MKTLQDQIQETIEKAIREARYPFYGLCREIESNSAKAEKTRILAILEPFCKESPVVAMLYEKISTEGWVE